MPLYRAATLGVSTQNAERIKWVKTSDVEGKDRTEGLASGHILQLNYSSFCA